MNICIGTTLFGVWRRATILLECACVCHFFGWIAEKIDNMIHTIIKWIANACYKAQANTMSYVVVNKVWRSRFSAERRLFLSMNGYSRKSKQSKLSYQKSKDSMATMYVIGLCQYYILFALFYPSNFQFRCTPDTFLFHFIYLRYIIMYIFIAIEWTAKSLIVWKIQNKSN